MAKKTYKTYHLKGLQLLLFDESGRSIEVNFRGGCQIDSTAKFSTSDEQVQKALEKSSGFKRDFYLDSVCEDATTAATEEGRRPSAAGAEEEVGSGERVQKVTVADKSEAIEWLKEHKPEAGYTATKLRSSEAFSNACAACNVEFEFAD